MKFQKTQLIVTVAETKKCKLEILLHISEEENEERKNEKNLNKEVDTVYIIYGTVSMHYEIQASIIQIFKELKQISRL